MALPGADGTRNATAWRCTELPRDVAHSNGWAQTGSASQRPGIALRRLATHRTATAQHCPALQRLGVARQGNGKAK